MPFTPNQTKVRMKGACFIVKEKNYSPEGAQSREYYKTGRLGSLICGIARHTR